MISLRFFPSRQIASYLARLFLVRSLAVLLALVLILMTLDLLGNSGDILAYAGNGDSELWRYVGLRVPQLISRFLPFSVLLGALITLATLNQHSEIITMKAAGISAHQIIAPLVLAGLGIALIHFAFNERVVTRATAALSAWEAVDYGPVPTGSQVRSNVWVQHGEDLVLARQVAGSGEDIRLVGITVYDRRGGTLARIINARSAERRDGTWIFHQVDLFDVDSGQRTEVAHARLGAELQPHQFTLAGVDPDQQDFVELRRSIEELSEVDRPTDALEAGLWHKFSGPLSSVLMPLLAAISAFGLARSGHLFLRSVIAMALGFAYFVADNFALAMGDFGAYPPFLAAWGPFLLFLLVGEAVLVRTEE